MIRTLTSKGQITLPRKIRELYNLSGGDKIDFVKDASGKVYLQPVKSSIKNLKRIVPKPLKSVSLQAMQSAIELKSSEK